MTCTFRSFGHREPCRNSSPEIRGAHVFPVRPTYTRAPHVYTCAPREKQTFSRQKPRRNTRAPHVYTCAPRKILPRDPAVLAAAQHSRAHAAIRRRFPRRAAGRCAKAHVRCWRASTAAKRCARACRPPDRCVSRDGGTGATALPRAPHLYCLNASSIIDAQIFADP